MRSVRRWTDEDGMGNLCLRLPPEDMATVDAALKPRSDRAFADARQAGRFEPVERYAADVVRDLLADARPLLVLLALPRHQDPPRPPSRRPRRRTLVRRPQDRPRWHPPPDEPREPPPVAGGTGGDGEPAQTELFTLAD
jgi:hypothetical protein